MASLSDEEARLIDYQDSRHAETRAGAEMWQIIANYMPLLAAVGAQIVMLALPIGLRNWRDDWLSALTYVGIQVLLGSLLYIVMLKTGAITAFGEEIFLPAVTLTMAMATFRVVKTIPMEGTSVTKHAPPATFKVDFSGTFQDTDARERGERPNAAVSEARRKLLHERLLRRKPDKAA